VSESADAARLGARLLARDARLWPEGNVSANRLGWLEVPRQMADESKELASWASTIEQSTVILLGMGGSSLGPAVLEAVGATGPAGPHRRLVVCDTTDPTTVGGLDFSDAFVLVSSKSGTTLEPNVLFEHAWSKLPDGSRYAAVTDPGTALATLGAERGFRRVFANRPDIGGRYSVLSYFGMVPAALIGYDVAALCERALSTDLDDAVELGWEMGRAAREGKDKVTIVVPEAFRSFGLWVEQLIAESTGKRGTGCVPVPTTEAESGDDRHVITLAPQTAMDLAEQFYRFELAVPIAGHVLSIDPFDEPNVAESKANTNKVLDSLPLPVLDVAEPGDTLRWLSEHTDPGDYVSLQAYVPFGQDDALESLRRRVRDHLGGFPVTAGYGPRFLHSTGQLHKGGPNTVVAVQLVRAGAQPELAIPDKPYDFGTLITAQSIGDHQSLLAHGRRVLRVAVDHLDEIA
jgi:glucose-6-phosphate isomerase/transaldolase/glucose-6-phosphate isomerase